MTGEQQSSAPEEQPSDERAVFTFRYGGKVVSRDPSRVYRAIADDPEVDVIGELQDLQTSGIEGLGLEESIQKVLSVVDRAFGVQPLQDDGTGMTEGERIELVIQFLGYVSEVKKKLLVWPTRWQRTDSDGSEEASTPKPDSDSSSTSSESTPAEA